MNLGPTRNIQQFVQFAQTLTPDFSCCTPKSVFLVSPNGFSLAEQSATDNIYMAQANAFDQQAALAAHHRLVQALTEYLPTICFNGHSDMPDAVFPNNVFGTTPHHSIIGRMLHSIRQKEATRQDIRQFFTTSLERIEIDLSQQPEPCELTGALVIDRARNIGWCGLSERCSEEGARLMHEAFGLRATLCFDLTETEYHTNVVLAILAGRAAIVCPQGIKDPAIIDALQTLYSPHITLCTLEEHQAFVGNSISITPDTVWMSEKAAQTLRQSEIERLKNAGFDLKSVEMSALEVAGGSLRCCIGEVY